MPFPLLLDPDDQVGTALRLRRQSLVAFVFNLRAWWRWLRAFVRRKRQYRITGHYSEVPAVAILTQAGAIAWLHRGQGIGDYPEIADVIARVARNTQPG